MIRRPPRSTPFPTRRSSDLDIAAPQATLMATIIKGLLSRNLPWGLVLIGVFISIALEICGIRSLSFAVGSYLDRKSTRLNSSHLVISYAVFCLKKKNNNTDWGLLCTPYRIGVDDSQMQLLPSSASGPSGFAIRSRSDTVPPTPFA